MATETYKWFRPDPNLRTGAAILANGDSAEISPFAHMSRAIERELGLPFGGTQYLFDYGTATDTFVYARCPDLLYPAISGKLTAFEQGTVVSTLPAGWTVATPPIMLIPDPRKKCILLRSDSIGAGALTTTGDTRDIWLTQAINGIPGQVMALNSAVAYREGASRRFWIGNMSLGSSSFDNSVPLGLGEEAYPLRESLAYPQRTATLAINSLGQNCMLGFALGTNDGAYDLTIPGSTIWARASARLSQARADFPAIQIFATTQIKRTANSLLNGRLQDYNNLLRQNFASIGVDFIFDFEANIPEMSMATGDTANTTYYNTDGIHPKTAGHALMGNYARPIIQMRFP